MIEKKFRAWMPLNIISKAKKGDEEEEMLLGGYASTKKKDTDGESLNPEGFDISYLKSRGVVNWNHNKGPEHIIGEPIHAEIKSGKLYVESKLYPTTLGKKVWELAKTLQKYGNRKLGYSIEGKATYRDPDDPTSVERAFITNVAVTMNPKNTDSVIDVLKGEFTEVLDGEPMQHDNPDIDELIANGGLTYVLDVTRPDGVRITVDNDYNIIVHKSLSANGTGAALKKESVDSKLIDTNSTKLTKSQVIERIVGTGVIELEKAEQIFSILNEITMSKKNAVTEITDEVLSKALNHLGVKGQTALSKGEKEDEEEEDDDDMDDATMSDDDIDENEDDDADDKKKKVKKSATAHPTDGSKDKFKKGLDAESTEKLIRSLATVMQAGFEKLNKNFETITKSINASQEETVERLEAVNEQIQKSLDLLEEEADSPVGRKSAANSAKPVSRNFQKSVDSEDDGQEGKKQIPQLSVRLHKSQIVNLMDEIAFSKGFDNEMAQAMTTFESSGQMSKSAAERIMKEKNVMIVE